MLNKIKYAIAGVLSLSCVSAYATPVTYIGSDNAVSSLADMVNSQAAAASFLAVTGPLAMYGFESSLPTNLTISGSTTVTGSCGPLCGFNTTVGGSHWNELFGGSVTFSFTDAVDAFGFYVNGLQTNAVSQQTIVYVDGSSATQTINMPSAINGGGAFVGFVDYGQLVSSVTFNASNDILGFDDLRFGNSATDPGNPNPVPEPATMLLFGTGLLGLAGVSIRRKKK